MDFNTGGSGGRSDDESRPLYGGEAGGRPTGGSPRGPAGAGGEFNLQDPIGSFISTVRSVLLNPVGFFRGIARRGDFVNPLVFALICALISGILGGIISFVFLLALGQDFGGAFGGLILDIIRTLILAAIYLFIGAGITHLLVMLFVKPANAGFEATFRVASYVQVAQLISWIPIIGWIVAPVYAVVLAILGIREMHTTTTGTAALVVLIPVAIAILLLLLLFAIVAALVGGAIMSESQQF
jgi:hypothetical protein